MLCGGICQSVSKSRLILAIRVEILNETARCHTCAPQARAPRFFATKPGQSQQNLTSAFAKTTVLPEAVEFLVELLTVLLGEPIDAMLLISLLHRLTASTPTPIV